MSLTRKTLESLYTSNDYDLVEETIRQIPQSVEYDGAVFIAPVLLYYLDEKYPKSIHNAVASTIANLGLNEYVPVLMAYVNNESNRDYTGSFLYALSDLNCKDYFLDFVEIIATGNFECRRMSWFSFEKYVEDIDNDTRVMAIANLQTHKVLIGNATGDEDVDRLHFIEDTLDLLQKGNSLS